MMEGETGTPVRLPDEETSFIGRKVEAPKRRQRLQQQRAQKKRLAVLTVSAVTVLAIGTVCVFLPSSTSEEVKTAVSQAMASDPAGATSATMTVPSFSVYDEDEDGQVTLGEYLDRLAINRDAALQLVDDSSFNETEKDRLTDLLREDFDKHSDCVARIAQQHDDTVMTEQNFNEVYKKITTEFCPIKDSHIPDAYQAKETAPGQQVAAESAASEASSSLSSSQSSSEAAWEPEQPVAPPRPVADKVEPNTREGITGSQPSEEKPWRPTFPTEPPTPSKRDDETWNPNGPTYPPVPSKATTQEEEPEWEPTMPTNPPSVADDTSNTEDSSLSKPEGVGTTAWNPEYPMDTPKQRDDESRSDNSKDTFATVSSPEGAAQKYPTDGTTRDSEQPTRAYNAYVGADTGAYNAYTGAGTTKYGENMRSESGAEATAQKYPMADTTRESEQPTRAYKAYAGADTGAYNAYTGARTTKYGENMRSESGAEATAQKYPMADTTRESEQPTRAYKAYAGADTGAYNAYTGARTTKYGENMRSESTTEGTASQRGEREWKSKRGEFEQATESEDEAKMEKGMKMMRAFAHDVAP